MKITEKSKDKHIFGSVKVGERGQIVIPKEARDLFGITAGDILLVFGDESRSCISIIKADLMKEFALKILERVDNAEE
jgi:AbrB family looped-hinge helix DNA binding protein